MSCAPAPPCAVADRDLDSKRAAPSPSAQSKRQRLSSPHAAYQSSHEDSLSSLSPSNSRISDGENDEEDEEDEGRTRDLGVAASKKIPQKTRPGVVAGKGPRKTGPPPAAAAALASAAVHIASVAAAPSHPTISSKQLPDHQPVPLPLPSASASVESRTSGMVSGKGKKGEDALQKGVAAREEVERRRVEYRGANAAAGDVPAVQPVAAAGAGTSGPAGGSKPRETELVVKSEEGEGGVETLVIPDVEEEIVTVVGVPGACALILTRLRSRRSDLPSRRSGTTSSASRQLPTTALPRRSSCSPA